MDERRQIETTAGHKLEMIEHDRLGFSLAEYQRRYDHVMAAMAEAGVDALLIRTPENICYVSGYETPGYYGYHCLILSRQDEPVLVVRRIESTNLWEFSWLANPVVVEDHHVPVELTAKTVEKMGLADKRIGVEKSGFFLTVGEFEALRSMLPKASIVDASGLIEGARMIKSEEEIEMIRKAVGIADSAAEAGIAAVAAGVGEDHVAGALHRVWCERGAEYTGLPNFVVSGPRSAACHATWRGRTIEAGDSVFFEIAAAKFRYAGAVMRCVSVGEPSPRVRALADATIDALEATIGAIRPGAISESVDRVGRDIIAKAGFGEHHHHRIGYSIGLNFPPDWGEGQIISIRQGEQRPLEANMTFHLVPACLIYRECGIGFSATVRVTRTGCEVLNTLPLRLTVN